MHRKHHAQRSIGLLVAIVIILNLFIVAMPGPVYAQVGGVVTDPGLTTWEVVKDVAKKVSSAVFEAIIGSATIAITNLMMYFTQQLAYQSAQRIVWGDEAGPLFDPRPATDYLEYIGMTIVAESINALAGEEIFDEMGICPPRFVYNLQLGLLGAYDKPTLEFCSFTDLYNSFEGYLATAQELYSDPQARNEAILKMAQDSINPNANELSASVTVYANILGKKVHNAKWDALERIKNDGFISVTDFLTGNIETPAAWVEGKMVSDYNRIFDQPLNVAAAVLSNPDALKQLGLMTGSIFNNTLNSE